MVLVGVLYTQILSIYFKILNAVTVEKLNTTNYS